MDIRKQAVTEDVDEDREDPAQRVRDLMDPAVLEARLELARARRARVLAAKVKEPRVARDKERSPVPPGHATSDAVTPREGTPAAGAADLGNAPLPFPFAAGRMKPPAADQPSDPAAEDAPSGAAQATHDLDRETPVDPVDPVAAPDAAARPVAPGRAAARRRRFATVFAAALTTGVVLGMASTLVLQGWQIAIVPPAAEGSAESARVPAETVEVEGAAVLASAAVESPAAGGEGSGAAAQPVPTASLDGPRNLAFASELAPATAVPPTPAQPVDATPLPALAPAQPSGAAEAQLAGLRQPAPVPVASPLGATDALNGLPNFASVAVVTPAPVGPPAPGQPINEMPVPALAPARPSDIAEAPPVSLRQSAPVPVASSLGTREALNGLAMPASAADPGPAVVPPALGQPVGVRSVPALAPAGPGGPARARLAGPLDPAPVPAAAGLRQALTSATGMSALPSLPGGAEPEGAIVARALQPTAPLLPASRHEARPPPAERPPEPTIASDARVAVHYPPGSSAEADGVSAELSGAGFADVSGHTVSFTITSPHVRFYHEVDRAAAERVASFMSDALDGAEVEVRSFTDFRPLPEEGLVEVWLAGEAPAVARAAAAPSAPVSRVTAPPPRESAAARRAADREAERQRLMQSVEQLLRARLR